MNIPELLSVLPGRTPCLYMWAALTLDWIRINLRSRWVVCDNSMSFENGRNLMLVFLKGDSVCVENSRSFEPSSPLTLVITAVQPLTRHFILSLSNGPGEDLHPTSSLPGKFCEPLNSFSVLPSVRGFFVFVFCFLKLKYIYSRISKIIELYSWFLKHSRLSTVT